MPNSRITTIARKFYLFFFLLILSAFACQVLNPRSIKEQDNLSETQEDIVVSTLPLGIPSPTPTSTIVQVIPTVTRELPAPTSSPTSEQTTPVASADLTPPVETSTVQSVRSFPDVHAFRWEVVLDGLAVPVSLANSGDGTQRLFIVEKAGVIRILKNGVLLDAPFLDIRERVSSTAYEQGLLGLAFHPNYPQTGTFFVNYNNLNGDTIIARFQVSKENPDRADPGSEQLLLSIPQPYGNHNGGAVVFGTDGYLYLALGDGGSAGDPQENAENTNSLLGKILRIDVNSDQRYSIPIDNPFFGGGGRPEIWAYGLRNPWRISFDRFTGDLYIADVGQDRWEEVNFQANGSKGGINYGWDFLEGSHPYEGDPPPDVVMPIYEYDHSQGCSITGGVVYRGQMLPEWQGIYLFADLCSGKIWGLLRDAQENWQSQLLFENINYITTFGEDEAGEVYLVQFGGRLLKLIRNPLK